MDLPQPPQEIELRNIIDKLAQFVARNGPEFEQMTKNKQKTNPKFSFLYGGEHFNYYQYKVTTEQAILKQNASRDVALAAASAPVLSSVPTLMQPTTVAQVQAPWIPPPPTITLETLASQQALLQEQIQQSEQNLAAQHIVLMQQQQSQVEDALRKASSEAIARSAVNAGLDIAALDAVLQPIIDTCTNDAISAGKSWILAHATTTERAVVVAQCLLHKVVQPGCPFTQKLHVIYLINDALHHCARKHADELKRALEGVVVPMFCNAAIGVGEDQQSKLNKLLTLWESKKTYFDESVIAKLKNPTMSWAEHQAAQIQVHAAEVTAVTAATKVTFDGYQAQHQAFVSHALQQIQTIEQQKLTVEQQLQQQAQQQQAQQQAQQQMAQLAAAAAAQTPQVPPPSSAVLDSQPMGAELPEINLNFSQPPPGYGPPQFPPGGLELPDLSKPPPGFAPPRELTLDDLLPSVPYFELPAGLMVPLIKLEDSEYKPLDPDSIRLPPPAPPNERLLAGVDAFYSQPCHERPRDSEGWEKLGLYEYYRAKNAARKKKEEDLAEGMREKSRSPTPVPRLKSRSRSPVKRRYRSTSRSRSRSRSRSQSRSCSPSASRRNGGRRSPGRSSRRSRSRSHSRSRSQSRSRSRSGSPRESGQQRSPGQSPSPPAFSSGGGGGKQGAEQTLSESNKGHQMLRKMGWGGAGLGAKEQGIEQPVSGGEVRDRTDMYKGIGVNLHDPYESFRKSKGQAFINRMKARAEERI